MPAPSALSSEAVLREAAQFVLETMFFAASEPIPPPGIPLPEPPLEAGTGPGRPSKQEGTALGAAAPGSVVPANSSKDAQIRVEISFEGDKRGRLSIGLPEPCARIMAASFEGIPDADAVGEASVAYVVLELANMICGATLTRLQGDGMFRLGSPEISSPELNLQPAEGPLPAPCQCWLRIPFMDDAVLHLALELEDQP